MIEFKENTAYHAETEKEAEWLLNKAHEQRYKWCDFTSFIQDNNWSKYTYQTCYSIKEGSFGDKGYYENKNYNIIKVKDLMQKNMTPKELQITAPEGWEIDCEKSTLDKIIFKEVKQKYPKHLLLIDDLIISYTENKFVQRLVLFGRLVLTCREWNRIDGFENKAARGKFCVWNQKGEVKTGYIELWNEPIAFKKKETAELFLSTFNKELQEVKEFL